MSFWPWKSRPVVTPFADPFSGRVHSFQTVFNASPFSLSVPSNLYIMPSFIHLQAITGAGIRSTTSSCLTFSRGGQLFAASNFGTVSNNQTRNFFLANVGIYPTGATPITCLVYPLGGPMYLYPEDTLTFTIPSFLAGDQFGPVIIHGKFWEVH
jgi:hypothetical protein